MVRAESNLEQVLDKFIEAWNVDTDADRRRLLEETCSPDIEISSPYGEYRGIDRQLVEISQFRKQFPDGRCRARVLSQHHLSLLQTWTTEFGGVRPPLTGIDCVQFDSSRRIVRNVSFSPVIPPP